MKGDFTRNTFKPEKHYSRVLMQQGRVQLDADWNEQLEIADHRVRTEAVDVIGHCGAPKQDAGFHLVANVGDLTAEEKSRLGNQNPPLPASASDFYISAGRYYVDGILCENEQMVPYSQQPDPPAAPAIQKKGLYLAYLDVWLRHLTALEDPEIREVALGGPDTATRAKTVWQVELFYAGPPGTAADCASELPEWKAQIASGTGKLAARTKPDEKSTDPCIIAAGAGYRRLENQLYRVEVHTGGKLDKATFKWSRDNGSVAAKWSAQSGSKLTVSSAGRDKALGLASGQWIELTDDTRELSGKPGTLVQLTKVAGQILTIDPATATGSMVYADFPQNPKIRRWDSEGERLIEIPSSNSGWIKLEDGVEVKFTTGSYKSGDYWLIPARTATGDVEWPLDKTNRPKPTLPHGIEHHYCRLALFEFDGKALQNFRDCRSLFPPLTDLRRFFYVGGSGQEALPGQKLPCPLQVGVVNDLRPVAGAAVEFSLIGQSGGLLWSGVNSGSQLVVKTDQSGVAQCQWELPSSKAEKADGPVCRRVEARLLNLTEDPPHPPIRFNANFSVAAQVGYDPSQCPEFANSKIQTVQQAIDELCHRMDQEEKVIGVKGVFSLADNQPLENDTLVEISRFSQGLRISCDSPLASESFGSVPSDPPTSFPNSIPAKPTCLVILDLPYPIGADRNLWDFNYVIGFQPLVLCGTITVQANEVIWKPTDQTQTWLSRILFARLLQQKITDHLLVHVILKGNFIWKQGPKPGSTPEVYLQGVLGGPSSAGRIDLLYGNPSRGSDFEMWFWLAQKQVSTTPEIVRQPESKIAAVGDSVTFSVEATGSTPLSFEWLRGDSSLTLVKDQRLSGVRSDSLKIAGVTASDAGSYTVKVVGAASSVMSQPAVLTIKASGGGGGTIGSGNPTIATGSGLKPV